MKRNGAQNQAPLRELLCLQDFLTSKRRHHSQNKRFQRTASVPRGEAPSRRARPHPKNVSQARDRRPASKANRVLAGTAVSDEAHSPAGRY
jgi:hypothetical protein